MNVFIELSVIVFAVVLISILIRLLRQPLVVGYILAGIIVGPYFLNILHSTEIVELFSKMGIAILLFIVGLSLKPSVIKEVGMVSLVTAIGQVIFTSIAGFAICRLLGFTPIISIYVAVALTFSSTIIVLKLLSDKGDMDNLYGKISMGFLLVQDLIAALVLVAISASAFSKGSTSSDFVIFALKGIGVLVLIFLVVRYVLPRFANFISSSLEFLFLASIAWGLGLASLFHYLGFSVEIGALVAGVSFSLLPFADEIGSRLKPLRDFFIVLFFVFLGSQMAFINLSSMIWPSILLSLFVLIGNPLIMIILMNLLGFQSRTGFLVGLTIAQISEFSLILIALGVTLGHLPAEVSTLVTFVGLLTIAASTYLIMYADVLYTKLRPVLRFLEWRKSPRLVPENQTILDAIVFGFGRGGENFLGAVKTLTNKYLVVDIDPKVVNQLSKNSIPHLYGDLEDAEFLDSLPLSSIKLIISTVPDFRANKLLAEKVCKLNKKATLIVVAGTVREARELYKKGVTYVVMPHYLGAQFAARLIATHGFNPTSFISEREVHTRYLAKHAVNL
ncbi:MAG TPA: cation:proton antiporter family protein [Candidatus Paceibacterota bacterium]